MNFVKTQKMAVELWQQFHLAFIVHSFYYVVREFRPGLRRKGEPMLENIMALLGRLDERKLGLVYHFVRALI